MQTDSGEPRSRANARLVDVFVETEEAIERYRDILGFFGYEMRLHTDTDAAMRPVADAVIVATRSVDATCAILRGIRQALVPGAPPRPVVVVGLRDDFATRIEAAKSGCVAFLSWPVAPMTVLDALERAIDREAEDPCRILIVDDSRPMADLHAALLRRAGMAAHVLTDPSRILTALTDFQPELILMDYHMPNHTGPEVAAAIRQEEAFHAIPIVFLSVEDDIGKQLVALGRGGDDFLTKPIDPDHLVRSVLIRAERFRLLRNLISRDGLTGLFNHTSFYETLRLEVQRARAGGLPLSLALLDIDHFKQINDKYGHATGDLVLRSMARLMRRLFRRTDVIGRVGGEEFAVILPGMDGAAAVQQMERVRAAMATMRHVDATEDFTATISAGVATMAFHPLPAALNEAADKALYAAKNGGRNRVVLAQS